MILAFGLSRLMITGYQFIQIGLIYLYQHSLFFLMFFDENQKSVGEFRLNFNFLGQFIGFLYF
jgi:hypothetical protein